MVSVNPVTLTMKIMSRFVPVLLLLVMAAGCAPSREVVKEEEELPRPREVNMADYEEFDASPYREQPPAADEELTHEVPADLMSGRTGAGEMIEMQGFRVQVFSSMERGQAEDQRQKLVQWWQENVQQDAEASEVPVVIRYKQPYYRVRIGNFRSRSEAEQFMSRLESAYGGAFVVPDQVQVPR